METMDSLTLSLSSLETNTRPELVSRSLSHPIGGKKSNQGISSLSEWPSVIPLVSRLEILDSLPGGETGLRQYPGSFVNRP